MNRFSRFELLVNDKFSTIANKTVLIVGIGGVGGYCFESLVRCGINNIIIIDYDKIEITNLNRQIIALNNNIGKLKVEEAQKRALQINPSINVIALNERLTKDNLNILNDYKVDYIVDACDTIETKVALIKYAITKQIKIISSMGMGNRLEASKIVITTLNKTANDGLAKIMRKKLREENVSLNIPVIWSKELPRKNDSKVIASCSYVPAVAGLYFTEFIINDILKSS